jgi:hypothetical protein
MKLKKHYIPVAHKVGQRKSRNLPLVKFNTHEKLLKYLTASRIPWSGQAKRLQTASETYFIGA